MRKACIFEHYVPVGRTVEKRLGSVSLLDKVCQWGCALGFKDWFLS